MSGVSPQVRMAGVQPALILAPQVCGDGPYSLREQQSKGGEVGWDVGMRTLRVTDLKTVE